jgi:hypothetical protein
MRKMKFTPTISKMIETDQSSEWYMAGTEGTGQYAVILKTDLGRVGFRLTGGYARVRVEPSNEEAAAKLAEKFPIGWKQPSMIGEFRFSKVFYTSDEAVKAIERAIKALGTEGKERRRGTVRYWRWPVRAYVPRRTAAAA